MGSIGCPGVKRQPLCDLKAEEILRDRGDLRCRCFRRLILVVLELSTVIVDIMSIPRSFSILCTIHILWKSSSSFRTGNHRNNMVWCRIMVKFDIKVCIRKLSDAFFYIVISWHDHNRCSFILVCMVMRRIHYWADSRFAPSQWETALLCNDVSHWLTASLESALHYQQGWLLQRQDTRLLVN